MPTITKIDLATADSKGAITIHFDTEVSVKCTDNHPWLTCSGNHAPACQLVVGQSIPDEAFNDYKRKVWSF